MSAADPRASKGFVTIAPAVENGGRLNALNETQPATAEEPVNVGLAGTIGVRQIEGWRCEAFEMGFRFSRQASSGEANVVITVGAIGDGGPELLPMPPPSVLRFLLGHDE